MTVKYLKSVQLQQHAMATNEFMHKYRAGYSECASAVGQYMGAGNSTDGVEMSVRARLMQHLQGRMQNQQQSQKSTEYIKSERLTPAQQERLTPPSPAQTTPQEPLCYIPVGLKIVPTRLANGDIAYVVPGSQYVSQQQLMASAVSPKSGMSVQSSVSPASSPQTKEMWRPW